MVGSWEGLGQVSRDVEEEETVDLQLAVGHPEEAGPGSG